MPREPCSLPWISGSDLPKGSGTVRTVHLSVDVFSELFYSHISYPEPSKQDQLHNLWGPVQDEITGPLIQKLLRISSWWLQSLKPSVRPLWAWSSVIAWVIHPWSWPCPKTCRTSSSLCWTRGLMWGLSILGFFPVLRNHGLGEWEKDIQGKWVRFHLTNISHNTVLGSGEARKKMFLSLWSLQST